MKNTFGFLMGVSAVAVVIAGAPAIPAAALSVLGYRIAKPQGHPLIASLG